MRWAAGRGGAVEGGAARGCVRGSRLLVSFSRSRMPSLSCQACACNLDLPRCRQSAVQEAARLAAAGEHVSGPVLLRSLPAEAAALLQQAGGGAQDLVGRWQVGTAGCRWRRMRTGCAWQGACMLWLLCMLCSVRSCLVPPTPKQVANSRSCCQTLPAGLHVACTADVAGGSPAAQSSGALGGGAGLWCHRLAAL